LAFAWQDATLAAVPLDEWSPATAYTLTIGPGARDENGRELEQPFCTTFDTAGAGGSLAPIGRLGHVWRALFDGPGGALGFATADQRETWSAWAIVNEGPLPFDLPVYADFVEAVAARYRGRVLAYVV